MRVILWRGTVFLTQRSMLKGLFLFTGCFSILATLLPLLPSQVWWIRIFDFPRIQLLALALISMSAYFFLMDSGDVLEKIFLGIILCCIIYQSVKIFPYTFLSGKHVLESTKRNNEENHLSIIITNVLMTNRNSSQCLSMLQHADPDIILAVETDKWWEKELSVLEEKYPYRSYAPLANTYGMLLYSKFKLIDCEILYLLEYNIPSVHCTLELHSGARVNFYGVHPKPPAPQESKTSIPRDAELIIIGKKAKASKLPVIVAGDLNDVAWSHTTHLFQKISGLLDPRVGRGLYPTYNAKQVLMRWPLDHLFHSNHFKLMEIKRLEYIGSDHFPILIKLSYEPEQTEQQKKHMPSASDKKEAHKKVEKAK